MKSFFSLQTAQGALQQFMGPEREYTRRKTSNGKSQVPTRISKTAQISS